MQKWNTCLHSTCILNVYVDKTQPRQFKFTFKFSYQVSFFVCLTILSPCPFCIDCAIIIVTHMCVTFDKHVDKLMSGCFFRSWQYITVYQYTMFRT